MGVISIDYQTLSLVVVLLFAAIGFTRGWLREGITTVLLAALVGVLYKPELVAPIASWLNKLVKLANIVLTDAGKFDFAAMATSAEAAPDVFHTDNPYNLLMWVLIVLVAISFVGGQIGLGDKRLTPASRIVGGIAGAVNGFIAIALFKEYLLRYFMNLTSIQAGASAAAAQVAAPKSGVSVAVQNVPSDTLVGGIGVPLIIGVGVAFLLVIVNSVLQGARHRDRQS